MTQLWLLVPTQANQQQKHRGGHRAWRVPDRSVDCAGFAPDFPQHEH